MSTSTGSELSFNYILELFVRAVAVILDVGLANVSRVSASWIAQEASVGREPTWLLEWIQSPPQLPLPSKRLTRVFIQDWSIILLCH